MNQNIAALNALKTTLRQAIDARDVTAESIARVNLACAYLQMESPEALPAFEQALAAVRRAQNPRSESILSMAFAPHFVDRGDPARALELAKRAEEIARRGRRGHRVLSLIQLARVLYKGFADPAQAGEAVDTAVAELAKGEITEATDREMTIRWAAQAALAAAQAGDTARALSLTRIYDPATAAKLEQRAAPEAKLSAAQREDLAGLYGKWQVRFRSRKADQRVAEMARRVRDMLRWDEARASRSGSSADVQSIQALIGSMYAVSQGRQQMAAALAAAPARVTDDDLVFALATAADPAFNRLLAAWAVFELVGQRAEDPALGARCLRLAAAMGGQERDPRDRLRLLDRADDLLGDGADDALHAEVVNEIAVCQLNLRQPAAAAQAAQRAVELARDCGDARLARMARGNVANAFLGLHRVPEALEIFEALERDQVAAGEQDMARITRKNIDACRAFLRR